MEYIFQRSRLQLDFNFFLILSKLFYIFDIRLSLCGGSKLEHRSCCVLDKYLGILTSISRVPKTRRIHGLTSVKRSLMH